MSSMKANAPPHDAGHPEKGANTTKSRINLIAKPSGRRYAEPLTQMRG